MCFHFPGTRPAVDQRCLCVAVGEIHGAEKASAGNLGLDRDHLLGVWGVHREKKRGKRVGWCSFRVSRYSSMYVCFRGHQGAV